MTRWPWCIGVVFVCTKMIISLWLLRIALWFWSRALTRLLVGILLNTVFLIQVVNIFHVSEGCSHRSWCLSTGYKEGDMAEDLSWKHIFQRNKFEHTVPSLLEAGLDPNMIRKPGLASLMKMNPPSGLYYQYRVITLIETSQKSVIIC